MKKLKLLCAALVAVLLTGCVCEEGLRREAVGPLFKRVADRHDAMVRGELDPAGLSAADRETYLRASQILRDTVAPPAERSAVGSSDR